jgi:hypothetical protein
MLASHTLTEAIDILNAARAALSSSAVHQEDSLLRISTRGNEIRTIEAKSAAEVASAQMKKFYEDVHIAAARVDARIRAVESAQWVDLDEKYGIRCVFPSIIYTASPHYLCSRDNIMGESRNMRALEDRTMRENAMVPELTVLVSCDSYLFAFSSAYSKALCGSVSSKKNTQRVRVHGFVVLDSEGEGGSRHFGISVRAFSFPRHRTYSICSPYSRICVQQRRLAAGARRRGDGRLWGLAAGRGRPGAVRVAGPDRGR